MQQRVQHRWCPSGPTNSKTPSNGPSSRSSLINVLNSVLLNCGWSLVLYSTLRCVFCVTLCLCAMGRGWTVNRRMGILGFAPSGVILWLDRSFDYSISTSTSRIMIYITGKIFHWTVRCWIWSVVDMGGEGSTMVNRRVFGILYSEHEISASKMTNISSDINKMYFISLHYALSVALVTQTRCLKIKLSYYWKTKNIAWYRALFIAFHHRLLRCHIWGLDEGVPCTIPVGRWRGGGRGGVLPSCAGGAGSQSSGASNGGSGSGTMGYFEGSGDGWDGDGLVVVCHGRNGCASVLNTHSSILIWFGLSNVRYLNCIISTALLKIVWTRAHKYLSTSANQKLSVSSPFLESSLLTWSIPVYPIWFDSARCCRKLLIAQTALL